jgi:hypothetical protein
MIALIWFVLDTLTVPVSDCIGAGKSRHRCDRPTVPLEIRRLIREMSAANPSWGAPRIHGKLLKLGIEIGPTSVAKYMARRRPPSQGWNTFLRNHAAGIATMDLFVVPTISFRLIYGLLLVGHDRRQILWLGVTAHPTAEWIANQFTEACGWEQIPRCFRDRDRAYGEIFVRGVRSICTRVLVSYMGYHNRARTHLSLNKDAPISRAAENAGRIICCPILGGLHHQYDRM